MRWLMTLDDEANHAPQSTTSPYSYTAVEAPDVLDLSVYDEMTASALRQIPPVEIVTPRVQREAMGSLFEIYLAGTDREALVGAGEQALDEIERLDRQLSHYKMDSDVSRLNAHAGSQWVRLEPRMYQLLKRCAEIRRETDGAFDITLGPLIKAWGFYRGEGRVPSDEELDELMGQVGLESVEFDDEDQLVRFSSPGMEINLGAVGKGYAIDEAVEILKMYGVSSAVVHGGQSSIYALGTLPVEEEKRRRGEGQTSFSDQLSVISCQSPGPNAQRPTPNTQECWPFEIKDPRDMETVLETVFLRDEAISTSGSYEQFFEMDGVRYSHILDPRRGRPVQGMLSVSVIGPSAAETDALSTAFFVLGRENTEEFCRARPNLRVIMIEERGDDIEVTRIGF